MLVFVRAADLSTLRNVTRRSILNALPIRYQSDPIARRRSKSHAVPASGHAGRCRASLVQQPRHEFLEHERIIVEQRMRNAFRVQHEHQPRCCACCERRGDYVDYLRVIFYQYYLSNNMLSCFLYIDVINFPKITSFQFCCGYVRHSSWNSLFGSFCYCWWLQFERCVAPASEFMRFFEV